MLNPSPPGQVKGFTLTELIVVLAIVALLAGIAVPIISNIRNSAASGESVSNLRQIGAAMQLYVNDNNGYYPSWVVGETSAWYKELSEGNRYGLPQRTGSSGYSPVFYSPLSDKDPEGSWPEHNPDYGINLAVINVGSGSDATARNALTVEDASKCVLMASTGGNTGSALWGDFRFDPRRFGQITSGFRPLASSYENYGWLAFRYPPPGDRGKGDMSRSSAVALFCDGHVELIGFDDSRLQTEDLRSELFLP